MRKILTVLIGVLLFVSQTQAGIFIYEPQDKTIVFDEVIRLEGVAKDIEIFKVNDQQIKVRSNDSFYCGLVLHPGKNLVEIRALGTDKKHFVSQLRILRLQTYNDIEELFDGQKHWARNNIVYLATDGFIEGYPDGNFYPAKPISRGELATWIARIKGLDIPKLKEDVFFDVPKEHWRAPYIKALVDTGVMGGVGENLFGIDDPISRSEAAEIAVRVEGLQLVEKKRPLFIDVPQAEKGASPIYLAREKGLVKGVYEDIPVYDPNRAMTRAEAVVLLSRFSRAQQAIKYLFDFNKGYSKAGYCKLNMPPNIISFTIAPTAIPQKVRNVVRLRAKIEPRRTFAPLSNVKVDLSEIGGMPDVQMFDDGTQGDEIKGDNIYSLNLSLEPAKSGTRILRVHAVDELGWEDQSEASLLIVE